jgi:hypothetical protein
VLGLRILVGDTPPPARVLEPEPETPPAARRQIRGPRADGMREGSPSLIGGGSLAGRDSVAVVPDLVGRVEGDARRLLERAGFTLGTIMFREDDLPVGTVLQTFPVPGERVPLPATVNLILADRRRPPDPLDLGEPDTMRPPVTPPDSTRTDATLPVPFDSLP